MRIRHGLLAASAVLLVAAPSAVAGPRVLWPGVTVDSTVQFTPHGPVALRVLTGPRPGGTTTLAPVLSNESIVGTETLTAMQRRITPSATVAGVNGTRWTWATGVPSGVFMREGQVVAPPSSGRSSAGLMTDGTLQVERIGFQGTWRGTAAGRRIHALNDLPPANGTALFTQAWGPATPSLPGSTAAILFPFPAAVPNTDLAATVVEVRAGGAPVSIPAGGAVVVGTGGSAAALSAEAPVGSTLTARLAFKPDWPGVVAAIGGGPQLVRNGAAVFRAGEDFFADDLATRAPRTAVGQLADGRIVLVAVDGRQPGYSVGMTNFELAQALVRLGAVTGMALDGGGSTTIAFDGELLNRPSDGAERSISTALMFHYTGVFVRPAVSVVSPDGDGVADRQSLRYKVVRPSTATVTLTAPDGSVAYTATAARQPGSYAVPFPPTASPQPLAVARTAEPVNGRWKLAVSATDDVGQQSQMEQSFTVNTTLGYLGTVPRKLFLPPTGRDLSINWKQARAARVVVTVETPAGEVVRTLAKRSYAAGSRALLWNGLDRQRRAVTGGRYVIRVAARNALGAVELTRDVRVQRIVGR